MEPANIDWKKYLIVFLVTTSIFFVANLLSNHFSSKKVEELKSIQDKIAMDILSSETQYSLLSELSCKNVPDSFLSKELGELGSKLEWSEQNLGKTEEVQNLRNYYALLQIKDYLLMKRVSSRCKIDSAFILYFYTTRENCSECVKQGIVLSNLREQYPQLRVYSFDYSTELSAVKAMLAIYKIEDTKLPALVVDDEVLTGFQPLGDLEQKLQDTFKLEKAQETKAEESKNKE